MKSAGPSIDPKELKYQLAHWNEDRRSFFISIITAFFVVAVITVILRLAARWRQRQRLQWDDYLILISLLDIGLLAETLLCGSHICRRCSILIFQQWPVSVLAFIA